MNLTKSLSQNISCLDSAFPMHQSFDLMMRRFKMGNIDACFLGLNGFHKLEDLKKVLDDLQKISFSEDNIDNWESMLQSKLNYVQLSFLSSLDEIVNKVLSGPCAVLINGLDKAVIIDIRLYPTRSIEEPDLERVTRGSRDGFVETLLVNVNLIRRRIHSDQLLFELHHLGTESRTDVSLVYMKQKVNAQLLDYLSAKIDSIRVSSLTMGAKTLEELLVPKHWWHPLPSIQMTERPDVACSYLLEGNILIITDNSPVALILPASIFQFTQSPEDYYNSTSVGTYFRLIRFFCIPVSLLLMPVFLMIITCFPDFTRQIGLLSTTGQSNLELFIYVLTVEFLLDLFKYSSALNSDKFSGSLSIVGGLIIGDIAVNLKWASVEALFYGAVTLLTSLSISSREFSDAIRIYRILLILFTGLGGIYGFCIGLGLTLLSMLTTPTFGAFSYFWPLFPLNLKALKRILFRTSTIEAQPIHAWNRGKIHEKKEPKK